MPDTHSHKDGYGSLANVSGLAGVGALRVSKLWLVESVGKFHTAKEVWAHKTGEALQGLHFHRVELPVKAAAQEVGIA